MTPHSRELADKLTDPNFRGPFQHLRDWSELDLLHDEAAALLRREPSVEPGDIIVRRRHGKWMADVVGAADHSGGWSSPVDAVRGVKEAARSFSSSAKTPIPTEPEAADSGNRRDE